MPFPAIAAVEAKRLLCFWCHIDWRNTKICIHRASRMEQKFGKCWKSSIFEGKLQVFISYLSEMKIVSMFYNSSLFYHFLFWRYLNSSMTRFLSDILLPFPNSNDLNSHEKSYKTFYHVVFLEVCLMEVFLELSLMELLQLVLILKRHHILVKQVRVFCFYGRKN